MEIIYKNKRFVSCETLRLNDVLKIADVKENRLCIFIDGNYPSVLMPNQDIPHNSSVIIYPELSGRTGFKIGASAVLLAATVASGGLGSAFAPSLSGVGLIAARTGILIGGALIATGLQALAPKALTDLNGQNQTESPTFSLTSSGNSIRPYEPLPIVFGTHNIFPDFSSIPYNEYQTYDPDYKYDSTAWTLGGTFVEDSATYPGLSNITLDGEDFTYAHPDASSVPNPDGNWYRYIGATNYVQTELEAQQEPLPTVGDKYRRTYVYITASTFPSFVGKWVEWQDFENNGTSAVTYNTGTTFPNQFNYEYDDVEITYPRKTEVVKQMMNYGWGDLSYLTNTIGTTDATDYRQYDETNDGSPLDEQPDNWTLEQGETSFITTGIPVESFLHVNGNVDTVDGGRLDNVPGFEGPDNYVIRQGPENTFAIQLDIEGRQFRLDKINGGTAVLTRHFYISYRQVSPVVTGWIDFEESMTLGSAYPQPYEIAHGSSGDVWRDTVFVDNLSPGQYEVRARRIEENETSPDNVSEIYFKRARFYQRDESQNYVAQNRKAIIIESDSQLNGTLNKLSSVVSAKCWKNDGFGGYTWGATSNPADWLLYYARGAFKNETADGTLTYPYSPTIGWVNSADHPDNGEILFGAAISDQYIDFASLTDWWNFCNDNNLHYDSVLDRTESVFETFKKICSIGRASPTWALGKLGVVFENPAQLPVAMFTPENILKDSFELTYITEDLPDEFLVNFINAEDNWNQDSVRATAIGVDIPVTVQSIDFLGITREDQAQREVNRLAARQTYNRRVARFSVDGEGLIVTRGDVITLSHDLLTWDYSSRIIKMEVSGNYVYRLTLDCDIDDTILNVSIRLPDNTINQYAATVIANVVTLMDLIPLTLAPFYLDQQNTENPMSLFPDTVPEDYLLIAGSRDVPGRPMRIVGVTPKSENEFEISCIEEDPGFYAQEYILSGLPPPQQFEHIKASVTRLDVVLQENGQAQLYWDLDGALAVTVMLSVNGGGMFMYTIDGATHFGNDIQLAFSTGDVITATVIPVYTDSPYTVETKTITFTVL